MLSTRLKRESEKVGAHLENRTVRVQEDLKVTETNQDWPLVGRGVVKMRIHMAPKIAGVRLEMGEETKLTPHDFCYHLAIFRLSFHCRW